MCERNFHSLSFVSSTTVKLNAFVKFTLLFKVLGTLNHYLFRGHKWHSHDLLIKVVLFGQSDRMMQALRFTEVKYRVWNIAFSFKMSRHREACLWIVTRHSNLSCTFNVTCGTENSYTATKILGLLIHFKSLLVQALPFKILSPPFEQSGVFLGNYKVL